MHFEDFPEGGGYPLRFLEWAISKLGCSNPDKILHLCSGSVRTGITVDIRLGARPKIVADCRLTPFAEEVFDYILADPPYSVEYARNLYQTEQTYPSPKQIVDEALRILRPNGRLGLLHFQVPMLSKPMRLLGVWGVTTGAGYAIRAWSLLQKEAQTMPLFSKSNDLRKKSDNTPAGRE
jgi:SAM-dependent methyltransferase